MTVEHEHTTASQDDCEVLLDTQDQVTIVIDGIMVDGVSIGTVRNLRDVLNSPSVADFLGN